MRAVGDWGARLGVARRRVGIEPVVIVAAGQAGAQIGRVAGTEPACLGV
ncbi:hypothetical protein E1H18_4782 [Caulobacter sp. RHG1]|nr:hypothetical protein [Caulobacter sp. RHG1]